MTEIAEFPLLRGRFRLLTLLLIAVSLASCRPASQADEPMPANAPFSFFATVQKGRFYQDGRPYFVSGVNFWQAMNLGMAGDSGDRKRLIAELDHLQSIGINNLRIMASSEGPDSEPFRITPALMIEPGIYNEAVLDGLDFLLAELGKRRMTAVMVLTNYWHWSGGMAQYVSWHEGSQIPYPGDWSAYMDYAARFYACDVCQGWYRAHIRHLIERENAYTGLTYANDPAIFSWELANEPRRFPQDWIDSTAGYIKSLDPNHLVTTGSEGEPPWEDQDLQQTHAGPDVDYVTIHIWPQNWGWYDPARTDSYPAAEERTTDYFNALTAKAETLNKPLVVEEFGLARDWEPVNDLFDPASTTVFRDRFFGHVFGLILDSARRGGSAAGANAWAWSGQALPGEPFTGDPPHETPGWYSIYDRDESTLQLLGEFAGDLANLIP